VTIDSLQSKLVHHIVAADRRDQARAARSGRHFNHYALSLMLGAAHAAHAEAAHGTARDWVQAVMRNFTPTRPMHTFLKKIDPSVRVEYGRWVSA
jgi:hypothetical protein